MRLTMPRLWRIKRHRPKSLGATQLFTLAFGAILGAGWIIALGQWLAFSGPVGTTVGFVIGAGVICLVALCYAELGAMYPLIGGEAAYAERVFGNAAGYFTGCFLAVTYLTVAAFEAISFGWIVEALAPTGSRIPLYHIGSQAIHTSGLLAGVGAVLLVAVTNLYGLRTTTSLQDLLTAVLILFSVVFILIGLACGHTYNLAPMVIRDSDGAAWPGILRILVTAPFWFSGFGVVAQALGDQSSPTRRRVLAIVLITAISASCLFYVLITVATAMIVPRSLLLTMPLPAANAFAMAFHSTFLERLVLVTGLLGLLVGLNAVFFSATRVLASLSHSGFLPRACSLLRKGNAPSSFTIHAVAFITLLGTALGQAAIAPLVDAGAITTSCVYLVICACTIRVRLRGDGVNGWRELGLRIWLPVLTTGFTVALIMTALVTSFRATSGAFPPELLALSGILTLITFTYCAARPLSRNSS